MTFSDIFSAAVRLRRIIVIGMALAGLGIKYGSPAWNHFYTGPSKSTKILVPLPEAPGKATQMGQNQTNQPASVPTIASNLGEVSMTNHCECTVTLGQGKKCLFTPRVLDRHNVELTLALETRNEKGRIQDLTVTQVTAQMGKNMEVAIGNTAFSMTPMIAE